MILSHIAIGSNLGNPVRQIQQAIQDIAELTDTQLKQTSSLYRSKAVGFKPQPNYINCVITINTGLPPYKLLTALQNIEHKHGRKHCLPWSARTLDLDIITYGQKQLCSPELTIPHPRLYQRAFVLIPMAEITPRWRFPNGQTLMQLVKNIE